MSAVVVTDGAERATLAVTRALGREGIRVIVGSEGVPCLAGVSRYCHRSFQYPSPYEDAEGFARTLLSVIREEKADVLIPMSDVAMSIVEGMRAQFSSEVSLPIPSSEAYESVTDKYRLMRQAREAGVPIPETWFVPNGDIEPILPLLGPFPLVVKPARSRILINGTWAKTEVFHVANREQLRDVYRRMPYLSRPSLIQRRIEGEGQGIFGLFNDGKPVTWFAHRRLREKPPSGGVSVLRESIELKPEIVGYAEKLLQNIGWNGAVMVEFKIEKQTNIPRLMEINGRFWGSLQLAIDAGLNFPLYLYQLTQGRAPTLLPSGYRIGAKSRWFLGDCDHLFMRVFKSDDSLHLPSGYPSRRQCVKDFLRLYDRNTRWEVERWDDLHPAFLEWAQYLGTLLKGHA